MGFHISMHDSVAVASVDSIQDLFYVNLDILEFKGSIIHSLLGVHQPK